MTGLIWCTLMVKVFIDDSWVIAETAAQGKVISRAGELVTVDFSEYAIEKGYSGDYSRVQVQSDNCLATE